VKKRPEIAKLGELIARHNAVDWAHRVVKVIARNILYIETLKVRNSDRLDFHELSVISLREALLEAYIAGVEAGKKL
jgi:hypothetical protein